MDNKYSLKRKLFATVICITLMFTGCTTNSSLPALDGGSKYFTDEESAEEAVKNLMKEKYGIDIYILDGGIVTERIGNGELTYYWAEFEDEDGLRAGIRLVQKKSFSLFELMEFETIGEKQLSADTYASCYYAREAYDYMSPYFEGDPNILEYYINLSNLNKLTHDSSGNLSMSLEELLHECGGFHVVVVLPPGLSKDEYVDMIYDIYYRVTEDQPYEINVISFYADNSLMYAANYKPENFNLEAMRARENIEWACNPGYGPAIPEERFVSPYYPVYYNPYD